MKAVIFMMSCLAGISAFTLPVGLRPAKAVGDPEKAIIPGQQEPQPTPPSNVGPNETNPPSSREVTPKVPPNLSLRSRMMAALSASPTSAEQPSKMPSQQEVLPADDGTGTKPPIIFTKNHKKGSAPAKPANVDTRKSTARVVAAAPSKPGANNYGLNTVLQTNLVDSRGRIMKGVNVVPIKVPTSAEMKSGRTRHA
ncbi:unnamed protein product [Toxocara canis]|uniref:WH2 domain-containing protein n=1 Tax=Toxocara canis TaxID=6265 RepID=A0A183TW52_TOXCA|nr:unnamed protein product [Toxocara canis]